ncbi:MAG: SMP-30/gluconolactonase/LRE family protein, partial [Gammaproteobacteria bacterium]
MKFKIFASITGLSVLYLLFWPVPIEPVAWDAPQNAGLVDPFEPNDRLRKAQLIDLGEHEGPEDVAADRNGMIYTVTVDGLIIRMAPDGSNIEVFSEPGGRPLGMEFDAAGNLFVANSFLGLQKVSPDGSVEVLTDSYQGEPITYADDVAVAENGMIYFSDASSKFGAMKSGGTYEASLLDVLEHGAHGRIYRYDPISAETTIVMDDLNFANGVAISADQSYLLVNETTSYRIWRHWLTGPDAGKSEVIIDNLPGFPDNITNGRNGNFWVGLVAPRNQLVVALSGKPFMRKMVQRLPAFFRPKAEPSSHV